jgi:FkbM family methyltransferase
VVFRNLNLTDAEPEVYAWFSSVLKPGMFFYDVGAFVGHYSLCAAKRVGPSGGVLAFEPTDITFGYLQSHVRLNGFDEQIRAYNYLVGDDDFEEVDFFIQGQGVQASNGVAFRRDVQYVDRSRLSTTRKRMRSLDSISRETGFIPNVIKIDVEGGEERVLRGAENTLRLHRPQIVCSIHPFWMVGLTDSVDSLLSYMHSLNYRAFDFAGQEKHDLGFEEVLFLPQ